MSGLLIVINNLKCDRNWPQALLRSFEVLGYRNLGLLSGSLVCGQHLPRDVPQRQMLPH